MRPIRFSTSNKRQQSLLQLWLARVGVGVLMAAALLLMMLYRSQAPSLITIKTAINDALAPVVELLSQPAILAQRMQTNAQHWNYTYEENEKLRAENAQLLKWQTLALRLDAENKALRKLYQLDALPALSYTAARVIGSPSNNAQRVLQLALARGHTVTPHQAVMTQQGLVGRILDVGNHAATALLITDINSRIPVISEKNRIRAILAGEDADRPKLTYLPDDQAPEMGERILTTDDGGVFPAGIPVGETIKDKDGQYRVQLFAKPSLIEYLLIATQQVTP